MTALNHAVTGAAIGLLVGEPLIAVPAAIISHFVCDALPHFGTDASDNTLRKRSFKIYLLAEACLCLAVVLLLFVVRPEHWLLAAVCAFAAAAPDFLWARRYIAALRHKRWRPMFIDRFASAIQWFQRPIGAVVEIAWFAAVVILLMPFFVS